MSLLNVFIYIRVLTENHGQIFVGICHSLSKRVSNYFLYWPKAMFAAKYILLFLYRCGLDNCRIDPISYAYAYALSDCCTYPYLIKTTTTTVRPVILQRGISNVIRQFTTTKTANTATTQTPPITQLSTTTQLPPTFKNIVQVPLNEATILSHDKYGTQDYRPNLSKAWEIEVTGRFHIQLKFTGKFDVRPGRDNRCSSEWVRVFDGNTELLPKTCNLNANLDKNMQANLKIPVSHSNKVTVFFKTNNKNEGAGFNLTREIVPAFFRNSPALPNVASPDECLWSCTWKDNPFYGVSVNWVFGNVSIAGIKDIIRITFTLPQIPRDLNCLSKCFPSTDLGELRKTCDSQGNLDDIDCLLYKRSRVPSVGCLQCNALDNIEALSVGGKKKRKRRQVINPPNEDESEFSRYFIPTSPLDTALAYCILANLDRRGRLPALGTSTETFYDGEYLFGFGNDCSAFLPNIFPKEAADPEDDRNFGPSSSNVEK